MSVNISFGVWLKRRRRQLDLTQKGLAYQAGCSVGTVRKIEADERRPSRQLAALLAQHLDILPEQREPFIAFARSEPYTADISFPILAPVYEQTAAIPAIPQESPVQQVKHNLPSATTPFLGRDTELAALDDLLINLNRRLVTIVGPGGIGKTRLALAYAEQLVDTIPQPNYPQGVFFVDLAPLPEAGSLILTLVETLELHMQGGVREKRSPKQQLLDHLRNRRLLLLLDNFEHLLSPRHPPDTETETETEGTGLVTEILQTAPEVRILITSRERLNLRMEQVFPLEGLGVPDWGTSAPEGGVEDVMEHPAVELFLQAAQRSQPDFALETHEELIALVRICRLVGGMPLALELAASWVDTLSLMDIAVELKRGLDILQTELRDVPERQRSVKATFDYSWQQLDKKEQSVFIQLSIFRGGFTRQAAQSVTGATLRQLSRLANKSFIQFNKRRDRYQIHELLRQYGAERLGRESELERGLYDRHSTYYCRALANHTDDMKGAGQQQAFTTIEPDFRNVRIAWNHAATRQDLATMGTALEALYRFYWNHSWLLREGIKDLEQTVTLLQTGEAIGARGIVLGRLLAILGWFYSNWSILDHAKAMTVAKESLGLLQRLGAREETVMPLLCLSMYQGSLEESSRLLSESLILARQFGDQWAIGDALVRLGQNAQAAGDYEKAEQRWREGLKQFRQNGDIRATAWALSYLSVLAGDRGRYEEALALAQENMSLFTESNRPVPWVFYALGKALYDLGTYEAAEEQFQQRLALTKEVGLRSQYPISLFFLGKIAFCTGDYAHAHQHHKESLAGALEFDNLELVAQNHDSLGRLYVAQSAGMRARKHCRAALQAAIAFGQSQILLDCLATVAELFLEEGNLDQAAMLAILIRSHPISKAKTKERAGRLLIKSEGDLSSGDLADKYQRNRQSDLNTVAAQLLEDLESP